MRFGRRHLDEVQEIQLTPLVDVVFMILVFYMTTSVFSSLERQVSVTLPTASSAADIERTQGEIYINVLKDDRIILNDRELTVAELQEVLYRVAEHFPGGAVIIRGDRDAMLGKAIAVLNCCRNADIQNVSFAALKEEEGAASAGRGSQ